MYSNIGLFPLVETKSRTSRWRHEKREREEAAAVAGLDQPPPAKWKHKEAQATRSAQVSEMRPEARCGK